VSNIRKSDVENRLSPQFRTKIHLCQPDATGFSNEEPTEAERNASDLMKNPLNVTSTGERQPIAVVSPKSVQD